MKGECDINDGKSTASGNCQRDIFRDTPIRYLGYANEVGEAFRAQVPVGVVRLSYVVASTYVVADAAHKGQEAKERCPPEDTNKDGKILTAVADTLIWQGLASVAIPGFTINRVCALTFYLLNKMSKLTMVSRKWTTTMVGLGCIPFIVKPIDRSVDYLLNSTLRKWLHIQADLKQVVHHERND